MHGQEIHVSVVVPVFNEEKNILELYNEIRPVLNACKRQYEIIFVDDGSQDKSLQILRDIALTDKALKVLALARNRGQTVALVCGIDHARGDIIILLDGDRQNDPRDIPMLIRKLEEGYDVVSGWRKNRKDARFSRLLPSFFANRLISALSGVRLNDYGCTLKAYRAGILKDIRLYGEMHRFIPIYASLLGARIAEVPVNHRPRTQGKSKYGMNRIVKVMLDLVTIKFISNYETRPIYVFGGSGIACILLSFLCVGMLFYIKFVQGLSMIQSPFLLLSALFVIIGTQSILMGILAEIQMRTYFEAGRKTTYRVREKINLT